MQKLQGYLQSTGQTQVAFALRVGISKSYLSELKTGKKTPSLRLAMKIQAATDSKVPAASWVTDGASPT